MSSIFHIDVGDRGDGLQSHLIFGAMFPLCIAAEGLARFFARLASDDDEAAKIPRSLLAQARANASIATSYALMARVMLHSSDRKSRSERLS